METKYNHLILLSFVVLIQIFGCVLCGILHPTGERDRDHPIKNALFLGNSNMSANFTRDDCVWRRANDKNIFPDPDVRFILYTSAEPSVKRHVDMTQSDWLRNSGWEPTHENIFLIHGYAGGDDTLPIIVLRDAYLKNGSYNVFMIDWGALSRPPCYPAAVHNMKTVAKCAADFLTYLRNHGMSIDHTTCVGHSLGAHVCGLMANYLLFRINKIIGLDPAKPLVIGGNSNKLDTGDANAVHVIHTNAGHYGESGHMGHVDFCINGGKTQPFCTETKNEPLCSHVWAVCYMAESLFGDMMRTAEPCTRRCPSGPRPVQRLGIPILMGQFTPMTAEGSYCMQSDSVPFCPIKRGGTGDVRCCIKKNNPVPELSQNITNLDFRNNH